MDFKAPGEASSSPGGNDQLLKPPLNFFYCLFCLPGTESGYCNVLYCTVPYTLTSVADPGCLSRILILSIPDPGSRIRIRIQQQQQNRREKKIVKLPFLCATNFKEFKIIQFLNRHTETFSQITNKLYYFLPKINRHLAKLSEIWVEDPRSGIRKNLIPDPDPRSGSATLQIEYVYTYV
jgi:hypothetical protein